MKIPLDSVKELRKQSGAGVMQCRNALTEAQGDIEKAFKTLKEQGLLKAKEKEERATKQGLVEAYIHGGGRIGAMVELNCETDFVARTDEFKELAHQLAMQIAAMDPRFISGAEVSQGSDLEPQTVCLLLQPYIKDPEKSVQDLITETIAKVGENIKISRFARFELGDQESKK